MHRSITIAIFFGLAIFAADVNEDLLGAARKGDLAAVKALCEQGASVETTTSYGQTPLYLAAMNGHDGVVRYLIAKCARTDVKDTFYKASVLDFVIQRKHYDVAKTLIANNSGNSDQELSAAAQGDDDSVVQAVLAKGKVSQATLDKQYEAALDQKRAGMAALLKQAGAHEPAPEAALDPKLLESYAGSYKTEQLPLDIKVFVKDGKLNLQATGQSAFVPKAQSPTVFVFAQYDLRVEFANASSFTLKQGGREFKFTKVVTQ